MLKYDGEQGELFKGKSQYSETYSRKWSKEEEEWILKKREEGYTMEDISIALNRTLTSVSLKFKRLKKRNTINNYNEKHIVKKYESNSKFLELLKDKELKLLDVYCGVNSFWRNNYKDINTTTNDKDINVEADYHMDALRFCCLMYSRNETYDIIDLDPFGSAYDCFDICIKMAKKGIIISFGEMGHKRWKRTDFVSKRYGIEHMDDFNIDNIIQEVVRIGVLNKKDLQPIIIDEFQNITRVYFKISDYKEEPKWVTKKNN